MITKQHITHGAIAAAVASAISGGAVYVKPPAQIVHSVNASKHAWPDLTTAQKLAMAGRLRSAFPQFATTPSTGPKIDIVCGDGACTDLAQDIDDACEDAGIDSALDRPVLQIGYGIYVQGDDDAANAALAAILHEAAGLDVKILKGSTNVPGTPLLIIIGKAPRA